MKANDSSRIRYLLAATLLSTVALSPPAAAQMLWSFESGLDSWMATGYSDSDFISLNTSTTGATDGTHSMVVETGPTYGWDVAASVNSADTERYNAFNTVAANLDQYTLDFDVTIAPDSYANVASAGNYLLLSVAMNSTTTGWQQSLNVTPNLTGLTGTFPVSVPMSSLAVSQDASFYQLNIGSNSDHTNGALGQGVKYYVDNIRFTPLPQLTEHTLFSWETPDNPATTTIDERFEGWGPSFQTGHEHSISTVGATDGTHSLQIDRTSHSSPNFTWGSQFAISSDVNSDPNIEEIDPTIQGVIDDLVSNINGGLAVAFDVRFDDPFPNSPSFTKFGVHFTDDLGTFYDAEGASFNGSPPIGTTGTVTIPLANMVDNASGMSLADAGLHVGTHYLRIGLSSNTDGSGIYQIDNFRIIREVNNDTGDFDSDGDVDGQDFLAWQRGYGSGTTLAQGDGNGDGSVDSADLAIWKTQYGPAASTSAVAAVPEPAAWAILTIAGAVLTFGRVRKTICASAS